MSCKWNAQGNFECFEQIEGFGLVDCESMKANSKNYMTKCTDVHCGTTNTTNDWLFATCPGYPTGGIKAGTGACNKTSLTIRQNSDQTYACSVAPEQLNQITSNSHAPAPAPAPRNVPDPAPNYVPAQATSYVPAQATNYAPAQATNYVPAQATNYVPAQATNYAPAQATNYVPAQATNYVPAQATNYVPTPSPATNDAPARVSYVISPVPLTKYVPAPSINYTPKATSYVPGPAPYIPKGPTMGPAMAWPNIATSVGYITSNGNDYILITGGGQSGKFTYYVNGNKNVKLYPNSQVSGIWYSYDDVPANGYWFQFPSQAAGFKAGASRCLYQSGGTIQFSNGGPMWVPYDVRSYSQV